MHVAVCDDDAVHCGVIAGLCRDYGREHRLEMDVRYFCSGEDYLSHAFHKVADILILDIYMEGMSGLELAAKMRAGGSDTAIILVTTSGAHHAEGFGIDAAHYLVKPVTKEGFFEAMRRARRLIKDNNRFIEVPSNRRLVNIPAKNILYVEVFGHNTRFVTTAGAVSSSLSLAEAGRLLNADKFIKCFRSCIVNMAHIERMDADCFIINNGDRIPIAKRESSHIKDKYMEYLFSDVERA